jgi:hypothetical protein
MEKEEKSYLKKLSVDELKALEIAKDHLQTSFSLKKSIGFIKFLENKES